MVKKGLPERGGAGKKDCAWGKAMAFFFAFFILITQHFMAVCAPVTAKEIAYLAKIGDIVITKDEFLEEMNRLHMSGRVGEALSKEKAFLAQDYRKFLNELIDNKLMVMEAERLELDKDAFFVNSMDNFKLNLFLDRMRTDEISAKVTVTDAEIEAYFNEEQKKKMEVKEEGEEPKEPEKLTPAGREDIRRTLLSRKTRERESEYFSFLRKKARVKINEEVLKEVSLKTEKPEKVKVAAVNGEPIYAADILKALKKSEKDDTAARKEIVERLILHKLLDKEVFRRAAVYEKIPELAKRIQRHREERLIDIFKRKTVLPLIKVDEKKILEYYNANPEKFMEPDMLKLRMILVEGEAEADALAAELGKGADFGYIAKTKSLDPSREKGGEMGWIPETSFPKDILDSLKKAKPGDILGPFAAKYGYSVFEFQYYRKGGRIPLEKVRKDIDTTVGREQFKNTLEKYLGRIKEIVPVVINEEEF